MMAPFLASILDCYMYNLLTREDGLHIHNDQHLQVQSSLDDHYGKLSNQYYYYSQGNQFLVQRSYGHASELDEQSLPEVQD